MLGTDAPMAKFLSKDVLKSKVSSYSLFEIIQDKSILCQQNYTAEQNSDLCDAYSFVVGGALIVIFLVFILFRSSSRSLWLA